MLQNLIDANQTAGTFFPDPYGILGIPRFPQPSNLIHVSKLLRLSVWVQPERLLHIIAQRLWDAQGERMAVARQALDEVFNLASDAIGTSLVFLNMFVDERRVFTQLQASVRNELYKLSRRISHILPVVRENPWILWSTYEKEKQSGVFSIEELIESCLMSSHLVSDAVFVTSLIQKRVDETGTHTPLIIAAGRAHTNAIKKYLTELEKIPKPYPIMDSLLVRQRPVPYSPRQLRRRRTRE